MFLGINKAKLSDTKLASLTSDSELDEPGCSDNDKGKFGADIISMHHDKYGSQKSSRLFVVPNPQSTFAHGYDLPSDMAMLKSDMKLVAHERDRDPTRMDSHKQAESQGRRLMGATGVSSSDKTLSSRRDYERLKTQCDSAMRELQALRRQHGDTVRKCETAMKESEYYRMQHKVTAAKLDQHQLETLTLRSQYNEAVADKHRLDQEVVNLQKFCEEDCKEVSELRRQQQESMNDSGNSETINQMYIAAVRKHEAIKDDYDSLRKLYADVFASHSAAAGKLELTQEELVRLKKQSEEIIQERNAAIRERNGLKQQCTEAIRQWDTALRERNEAKEALIKVQQQRDEAMKDINQAMAVRLKASKDLARLTEERNAAVQEYSLIMSERDSVHKEIEKLQEELLESSKKTKILETQKKVSFEEVETLQREIASALHDRDRAIKQCHELREKYGDYESTIGDSSIESQEQPKDYEYYHRDRNVALQSRIEMLDHSSNGETFSKTKKERVDNLDQANQEIDRLRKQVEKLQTELSEASQEAEVSKRRRDWAFSERDKIVQERESIRTLCDKLRRERDRAVSDLAEALSESDDIKKQRNEASKELKELREKIESQLEKESRIKHLHSLGHNHSRDSAIDADLQEWETETLEFDIGATNEDEVGFELSGGKDDPQFPDIPIYVCNVMKGSPADGKLRVNDCVVLVNNADLTSATRSTALEAVRSSGGIINMVVRRRRLTSSRLIQSVHLNLSGNKEHGLSLETGVYVNKIAPGSVAAKEGNLALGDRVISVNGRSLDGFRFGVEAMKLLDLSGDNLVLSLLKCVNPQSAPLSSSSSGHNIQDNDVDKHSCSPKSYSVANRSPLRDGSLYRGSGNGGVATKEPVKKLTTSSSQTEDVVVNLPTSPDRNLVNGVSCDDSASSEKSCEHGGNGCTQQQQQPALPPPPPPQTFLDKFFGDRRSSTKEHKSKKFSWASTPLQEEEAIAELDSVIDYCKKSCTTGKSSGSGTGKSRKKRTSDKASEAAKSLGTWPKYRGPPLEYMETVPGTMTHSRRKRERVSIASLLSAPKLPATMYAEGKKQQEREHERERLRERREREIERERGGGRDLDVERSLTGTRRSSAGNGSLADRERAFAAMYKSEGGLPPQITSSGHGSLPPVVLQSMKGHFLPGHKNAYPQAPDVQLVGGGKGPAGSGLYSTSSSLEFPLDYSVVSANRDKEVLEYYKSRARPKSAMYLPSDRERFSSPDGSAPAKPSGLDLHALVGHMSRSELSPSDHLLGMSPRLSDREAAALLHHSRGGPGQPSASSYVAHPSSSASPNDNFPTYYTVSQGRMAHNNHVAAGNFHSSIVYSHHTTGLTSASSSSSAGVGSPSPRYSSPPYMSRSGESLLGGGSIPEGAFHPPPLMPPSMDARAYHRYVMNQSPSPQHYPGYSHSPSHSMELPHFHPVVAGSAKRGSSSSSSNAVVSIPAYRGDVAVVAIPAYRGDVAGFGSYDGPAAAPKRPPYRIRIPSNQSVTSKSSAGKVSTGSIERGECCRQDGDSSDNRWRVSGVLATDVVVSPNGSTGGKLWSSPPPPPPRSSSASISDRGSPMPAFRVETVTPGGTIVPRSLADFQNKKPAHGELRNIRIDKTAEETLGIQIDCGTRGGIFVSQVTENSLAQQAGIHIGDQLLEVCGINLRSATYSLAANVLRQCGDSITIKVQYNHEKCREVLGIGGSSSSEGSPIQTPTPRSSPKSRSPPQQLLDMDDSLPTSTTSTLKRQDTLVGQVSRKSAKEAQMGGDMYAPRYVFLKMATSDLGITFLGGNAVGIFVHKVQSDSPASGPNGLRCGDQILEYNGIDLKHATAEQAAYELAKRAETITILSQFNIDRYNEIQHLPGDSFFIRAMFDHQAENPNELSFRKDDILFVDNTMFNGVSGLWRAWVVDEDGHKKQCGVIPSKYKVEEELLLKRSLGELDSDSGSRRSASTSASSARRSFFRRYRKHQRSNSRDSKELASFSDISINSFSDSGTLIEDPAILTYQRVERLNDLMLRPVLLLGPLIDTVVDKLVQDFPRKFVRCVPEVVNATEQSMEEGVLENLYIDYRRRGSHYECLTLSTVRDMCDENCHCIVDVSPAAVERLHRNQIYPVVLFIKFKSTKQIREVKDPRLCLEKVTTKAAKEMYEHALRLESEYKHLISATIPGGNLAYMCSQIEAQVEQEQNKVLWVPTGNI